MGKQIFDRTRKILGISLIVLFVMPMGVALVSAQPQGQGGAPSGQPSGQSYGQTQYGGQWGDSYHPSVCYRCCWNWYKNSWHWSCKRIGGGN